MNVRHKTYPYFAALLFLFCSQFPSLTAQTSSAASGDRAETLEDKQADIALNAYVVGAIHEHKEDWRRAITAYQTALRFDDDAAIHQSVARCAIAAGYRTLAISHLRMASDREPGQLLPQKQLGELYVSMGRSDSATIVFEQVLARDSSDQLVRNVLAQMYEQSDTTRAIALYRAVMLRGADHDAAYRLANLLNVTGKVDSATAVLEDLRTVEGDSEYLLQTTARLWMRQYDFTRAAVIYDTLRVRHPEKPAYALLLAEALMNKGDWDTASDLLYPLAGDSAIGQEDRLQIGKLYFQKALRERRDINRALEVFETLHASFPEDWRPLWFRGAVLFNEGDRQQSISVFREALQLDPGNVDIQRTLEQLTQQQ